MERKKAAPTEWQLAALTALALWRALAVCGQFTSDVANLSERHDELAFEDE